MSDHLRVKDKQTGHEYTIPAHLFNAEAHTKTDKSAYDQNGDVAQPKFRTTVTKAAAAKTATRAAKSGQQADHTKGS